jgi:HAE1 family hydrophobic/amphiphilic exporter-1
MGGIIGRLFREFALTVTASILVSALVSLTLAPMLCSRFMRPQSRQHGRIYRVIEAGFDGLLDGYRRTLDIVLRHQRIALTVFLATIVLTLLMFVEIPKGFFPIQDTGLIIGLSEGAQDVSPQEMMRLQQVLGEIVLRDPDVAAFGSNMGSGGGANASNSGRFFIVLKPRDQRTLTASQVIDRLRPACGRRGRRPVAAARTGHRRRPPVARAVSIHAAGCRHRGAQRLVPEDAGQDATTGAADVATDLLSNAPQLKITVNRDQAARFGISPQLIDDTNNDAFGQRQITQYFTQINTYFVISKSIRISKVQSTPTGSM